MWFLFEVGVIIGGLYAGKAKDADEPEQDEAENKISDDV